MVLSALNLRNRSLPRGIALVLGSLVLTPSGWLVSRMIALLSSCSFRHYAAALGAWDTIRCLRHRWSFYHGAVVVLIYMDIMALCMILFLLLYPYGRWLL